MHLAGTIVEEGAHVVSQLCATYDGVVAEHHPLSGEDSPVGYEFHLGHESSARLVARCETPGPRGGVFQHCPLVGDAMSLSISYGHSHARVGHAANDVGLGVVFLAHNESVALAHVFHVHAKIVAGGESVIHPKEGANLFGVERFLQHLHAVGPQSDDFSRSEVVVDGIVKIGKTRRLAGGGIRPLFLSDDDRCAPVSVARSDDAVFGENEHGARALYLLIDDVDAVDERGSHIDEQCHEFGLVDFIGRHLAEVHPPFEQLLGNLSHIVDFRHGDHGVSSEM